jgi:hypothetical protein
MEPESQAPKKRVYRRKSTPVSEDILNVVAEMEGENAPKTKRAYKRKSVEKSAVLEKPVTISVQHNAHTDSLRPAMPVGAKANVEDPFAILDKELEYKDFFEKYEKKDLRTNVRLVDNPSRKTSLGVEDFDKTKVRENYDDLENEVKPSGNGGKFWKWLLGAMLLATVGYGAYVYIYPKWFEADYLRDLGKIAILPTNETPVVYLVTKEAELLKNPLFSGVELGDRVFLYENNKKMYVYRESSDKIVTIANIDTNNPTESNTAPAVEEKQATTAPIATSTPSTTTKATSTTPKASTTTISTIKKTTATSTKN